MMQIIDHEIMRVTGLACSVNTMMRVIIRKIGMFMLYLLWVSRGPQPEGSCDTRKREPCQ